MASAFLSFLNLCSNADQLEMMYDILALQNMTSMGSLRRC